MASAIKWVWSPARSLWVKGVVVSDDGEGSLDIVESKTGRLWEGVTEYSNGTPETGSPPTKWADQHPDTLDEAASGDVVGAEEAKFLRFSGSDSGSGVTSVDMGLPATGVPIPTSVNVGAVAVAFQHDASSGVGDWTLRLRKNGTEVATFSVST